MFNFSLNPFDWGRGEEAGHTEVGEYLVDTCYTRDCGFETAILKNDGDWIVVEYYKNLSEAKKGHEKWCKFCETNPKEVYSIQINQMKKF